MEKKIKIEEKLFGKKFEGEYVFRTISWGRSNEITSQCSSIDSVTRRSSIDLKKMQAMMLFASLSKKPSSITMDVLMTEDPEVGIPPALGEILMAMADKVNGYGPEEREDLKKLKRQWGLA